MILYLSAEVLFIMGMIRYFLIIVGCWLGCWLGGLGFFGSVCAQTAEQRDIPQGRRTAGYEGVSLGLRLFRALGAQEFVYFFQNLCQSASQKELLGGSNQA